MKNDFFIHPTAVVGYAELGKGTQIWHFSHICGDVKIGDNCVIGQNVYIGPKVKIDNGCKIQNNTYIPEGVIIENDVFIGPSVIFNNISSIPRAFISKKDEFENTLVKTGASIGANTTIMCGIQIGRYAMVGVSSFVNKSVGDFQLVFGNPATVVGTVSMDGEDINYRR
jgi:UDP-2-acetamido-3-amino-2,3-dideoxy-glucuronate N-acetyltransferase